MLVNSIIINSLTDFCTTFTSLISILSCHELYCNLRNWNRQLHLETLELLQNSIINRLIRRSSNKLIYCQYSLHKFYIYLVKSITIVNTCFKTNVLMHHWREIFSITRIITEMYEESLIIITWNNPNL